jgi:hypothetical protein
MVRRLTSVLRMRALALVTTAADSSRRLRPDSDPTAVDNHIAFRKVSDDPLGDATARAGGISTSIF